MGVQLALDQLWYHAPVTDSHVTCGAEQRRPSCDLKQTRTIPFQDSWTEHRRLWLACESVEEGNGCLSHAVTVRLCLSRH